MNLNGDINPLDYSAVQISLASADQIISWSHGEIKTSVNAISVPRISN